MLDIEKMEDRRRTLGLSQHEAAVRAGLAGKLAWNNIISGRKANVTLETLKRIAGALECDPRKLIKTPPSAA